ncbi:MAG: hypothetical protein IT328_23390 [Caldilineaceae bacterium]|nr:hypothetical protein [Caldilineaceae bacterium]
MLHYGSGANALSRSGELSLYTHVVWREGLEHPCDNGSCMEREQLNASRQLTEVEPGADELATSTQVDHEIPGLAQSSLEHRSPVDQSDELRLEQARDLGLPDTATWADIFSSQDEWERAALAEALGMPTYPLAREYGLREFPSWRNLFTKVLDLPTTATLEQILTRMEERHEES